METITPNRRTTLYTSPGGVTNVSGAVIDPAFRPILPNTFVLGAHFGGDEKVAQDNGTGSLFGENVDNGTIDYSTGAVDIEFSTAPDAGDLIASWLTDLD
jgi:hypothetical protein